MLALLLIGLMPISWLFSVSSRSLLFVVWLHAIAWIVAASFGARFLSRSFDLPEVGKAIFLWLLLFASCRSRSAPGCAPSSGALRRPDLRERQTVLPGASGQDRQPAATGEEAGRPDGTEEVVRD